MICSIMKNKEDPWHKIRSKYIQDCSFLFCFPLVGVTLKISLSSKALVCSVNQ